MCMCVCEEDGQVQKAWDFSVSVLLAAQQRTHVNLVIMWFKNRSFLTPMTVPFHHLSQSNPTMSKHFFAVMETACKTATWSGVADYKKVKINVKLIVKNFLNV